MMALHGGERRVLFFNGVLVFHFSPWWWLSVRRRLWWIFAWFTLALVPSCIRPWPTRRTWDTRDLAIGERPEKLEIHGKAIPSCRYPDSEWCLIPTLRVPSNLASVTWQTGTARRSCPGSFPLTNLCQTVEGFGRDVFLESEVMSKQIIGSFKQPRPFCWISFAEYPTQQTQVTSNNVNILCQCRHPAPLRCAFMSLTTCSST